MAHECPDCYMVCYCGGDIDDIEFDRLPSGGCRCDCHKDKHGILAHYPRAQSEVLGGSHRGRETVTGVYVRMKRDGCWDAIDFTDLTDDELEQFATDHPEQGWRWATFLAKWIRDNVEKPATSEPGG